MKTSHRITACSRFVVGVAGCFSMVLALASESAATRLPTAPGSPAPVWAAPADTVAPAADRRAELAASYGRLPMAFEANRGQLPAGVDFAVNGNRFGVLFTSREAVFSFVGDRKQPAARETMRMRLVDADVSARGTAEGLLPGTINHLVGNRQQWAAGIPTSRSIRYTQVLPGVDLVYYGNNQQLEYDFRLSPLVDPNVVMLEFEGCRSVEVETDGTLALVLEHGTVRWHKPVAYQIEGGRRQPVGVTYAALGAGRVGFRLAAYDRSRPLVIDPVLGFSTYFGGTAIDVGYSIAVDAQGSAYVTGSTASTDLPVTAGSFQPANAGGSRDAYVAKLNPAGTALVYCTYVGGLGQDLPFGIAVDAHGDAVIVGYTDDQIFPYRSSFPVTNGSVYRGNDDGFITKLNPTGTGLLFSSYLGGTGFDQACGVALDSSGNIWVTGVTYSTDFPLVAAVQGTNGDNGFYGDAFVQKYSPDGALLFSTYLGGNDIDVGLSNASGSNPSCIAVDAAGNAYVAGETFSTNFPTTPGAYQPARNGDPSAFTSDIFVVKYSAAGALVYSTYLGGTDRDGANAIAVDSGGNACLTGFTWSTNFPVTAGAFQPSPPTNFTGSFVAKLNATGSALVYASYLYATEGRGIAVDSAGQAYVAGLAGSDLPLVNPISNAAGSGGSDAFVSVVNAAGSALVFSSLIGGNDNDFATAIALDASGRIYLTGGTYSTDFPTVTPLQPAGGGAERDAFVLRIDGVTRIAPAIEWLAPSPITYGTALSATQLNATANVPGSFVYSPAVGALLDVGIQTLSATFTPADTTNYTTATATQTLTVISSDYQTFLQRLFPLVLGRQIDPGALSAFAAAMSGGRTRSEVYGDLIGSAEYSAWQIEPAIRLYYAALARPPEYAGLQNWVYALHAGVLTLTQAADQFASSTEFLLHYGSLTNTQYVQQLYRNVLGREADPTGLADWVGQLDHGASRGTILVGFSESDEFKGNLADQVEILRLYYLLERRMPTAVELQNGIGILKGYGQTDSLFTQAYPSAPSDSNYVQAVFLGFLRRNANAEELSAFAAGLAAGTVTHGSLVETVMKSDEFNLFVAPVSRLYLAALRRVPDQPGLDNWVNFVRAGTSLQVMADAFASSQEFINRYGAMSNRDYVAQLYRDVLGREADPDGLNHWTGLLDAGGTTRGQILIGFSESQEAMHLFAPTLRTFLHYFSFFNASPTQQEIDYWKDYLATLTDRFRQTFLDAPGFSN